MPSKTLVINCGASHVAAAIFSAANGKLTLEDLDTREIRYDVAKDEAWLPAVAEGLRDLARANSRFRGKATFILPGYQLLIKPIKVPHVEAAKQSQIIAFEAQNNIPFPLAEAVWGSQVISDDGIETEVLLAAQKADAANRFCGLMASQVGLQPIALQPSSLHDYNAYKLAYGADTEDTLIVNLGARSTNLTFISAAGLFIRNINIGGNTLTQSLADTIGKPFNEAEDLKIEFYSGNTTFEAENPLVAQMQTKAQEFMRKVTQQITQSIIAYRRATSRAAPARMLLTGRASLLSGLPEFLSETQKISVDYFNPSAGISIASRLDKSVVDQHYYQISEIVGEAAQLVKADAHGINLLPHRIRKRLVFEKKKPFLVAAAVFLALAPLPMLYKAQQQVSMIRRQKQDWDDRSNQLKGVSADIKVAAAKATDIRGKIAQYEDLMNSRFNWIIFFSQLQGALVDIKDVWLDSLQVDREVPPKSRTRHAPANTNTDTTGEDGTAAPPPPLASYKINVKGRMLLRDSDPDAPDTSANLSQQETDRINQLKASFKTIPFVKDVDESSQILDLKTNNRMVGFEFTVIIDPQHPL